MKHLTQLPRLHPLVLRPETELGYERVAWRPTWKCFCCHDTGLVQYSLLKQVMPDYDACRHKPVKCNASLCEYELGITLQMSNTLDLRFDSSICDRLDKIERQSWQEWEREKHELRNKAIKRLEAVELTNNLRQVQRSATENLSAQQKHREIGSR